VGLLFKTFLVFIACFAFLQSGFCADFTLFQPKKSEADKALEAQYKENKEILKEMGIRPDGATFIKYIKKGDVRIVALFLEAGIGANYDFYGDPAILYAVKHDNFEVAKLLLERGAKINQGFESMLYYAVKNSNPEMARLLIEYGDDVNYHTFVSDESLLNFAIKKKKYEMVKILLENGARTDAKTQYLIEKSNKKMKDIVNPYI